MTPQALFLGAALRHLDYRLRALAARLGALAGLSWVVLRTLAHDDNGEPWITLGEAMTLLGGFALMAVGVCLLLLR